MLKAFLAHRLIQLVVAPLLASGPLALAAFDTPAIPAVPGVVPPVIRPGAVRVIHTLADIPLEWRKQNWLGRRGQGSCVHAAMRHLLHWQGQHDLAEFWARNFGDGEHFAGLAAKLDAAGVVWAGTETADENFLNWAVRTRRGAGVVVNQGSHMVNLVGLDQASAYILDSNEPDHIQQWDRDYFLQDWRRSGGWAVTPVYTPPSPRPKP